jgi:hypothetical protein
MAIDKDSKMVWNVDDSDFPKPPTDDDPPVLEEHRDEY